MTAFGITGLGITGLIRMAWVNDQLTHVLEHSQTDETTGTWTGLACPRYGLAQGTDVDNAMLHRIAAQGEIADLTWETPDDLAAEHNQSFLAALRACNAPDPNLELADQLWDKVQAIWSQAWSMNYAALELLQNTGLTRFSPVKPQNWVIASYEHHCSPHGLPHPHIHNIVIPSLTTGT